MDKNKPAVADKVTIQRRQWPAWVIYLFCLTSVLLFVDSVLEMPERLTQSGSVIAFGVFKVVVWGILLAVYMPETIKRLKGTHKNG